jgi:serine/threonine protein phosphatase PrpC
MTCNEWNYSSEYSYQSQQRRYEDAVLVDCPDSLRPWSLFAVFDGHHGDKVARFLQSHMASEVAARLCDRHIGPGRTQQDYQYAEHVRRVLTGAFISSALELQRRAKGASLQACGSTATVALQTGPLLTVANIGTTKMYARRWAYKHRNDNGPQSGEQRA